MKKKKGFTLIELLATLVILAFILVIAVPRIVNVIDNSKLGTITSSAKVVLDSAEKKQSENQVLENPSNINCENVSKLNDTDYNSCDLTFNNHIPYIVLVGSGKLEGYKCEGTKENLNCRKVININLTIDLDGGVDNNQSGSYERNTTLELNSPTKEGYTFTGWQIVNGDGSINNNVLTFGIKDIKIKAIWKVNTQKLTIDLDGGIGNDQSGIYDIGATIELIQPTKEGYVFSQWKLISGNSTILDSNLTIGSEQSVIKAIWVQETYIYAYTGDVQTFTAPETGYYQLELWGAQGGNSILNSGGLGGYATGYIRLSEGDVLHVYVGQSGGNSSNYNIAGSGGYNGGGNARASSLKSTGGGGGATDIRYGGTSYSNRIIVAGGGGGAFTHTSSGGNRLNGGSGGGTTGTGTNAGGQTGGNALGIGGSAGDQCGGGGGGYYGGGAAQELAGGGGSGYIGGVIDGSMQTGVRNGNGYAKILFKGDYESVVLNNVGDYKTYNENGKYEIKLKTKGTYKLEVWGAQGGNSSLNTGGLGGYAMGYKNFDEGDVIYIYVGGQGGSSSTLDSAGIGGYNGGGNARASSLKSTGGGGGATDIRYGGTSYSNRIIVAGGGGGAFTHAASTGNRLNGGSGGGEAGTGNNAGTQTGGNALGIGGSAGDQCGGGGGGYYGGGAAQELPGSGGSGYIGGVTDGSMQTGVKTGSGSVKITLMSK